MVAPRTVADDGRQPYHHGDLRRSLVDAALALVTEEQDWGFSLREVARRAGVSHNAPYNHFADKRDLLGAVAAAGYEALHARLAAVAAEAGAADEALVAIGAAYIRFGLGNPAHYRLMFGPELVAGSGGPPASLMVAAGGAKSVLAAVLLRGARAGVFAASPEDEEALGILVLSAWSLVHGLTLLLMDRLAGSAVPDTIPERVARTLLEGVRLRRDV